MGELDGQSVLRIGLGGGDIEGVERSGLGACKYQALVKRREPSPV